MDLPWSMWAMMEKLRIVAACAMGERASGGEEWTGEVAEGWGGVGSMWPDRITGPAAKNGADAPFSWSERSWFGRALSRAAS